MTHKAVPGQPLIVKAGEYNAAMEAGQWFSQQKQLGESQSGIVGGVNPCVVKVKNDSGGNLAAGTVVELSSSLLTTLDRQHLWLSGIARAGNDPGFGVLIEPIKSGEIGPCQVSGVCLASVDIQDADNTHARLVASSTTLKGCFGGPVEILQKPSGTGVKTCVVRLGVRQSIIRRAKAAEAINAGDSGDVDVYLNGSSRGTIEAFNNWDAGDVANDDEIRILYHHDLDKWEILKRGGSGAAAVYPMIFRDSSAYATSGISYPRGGGYGGSEYYTMAYAKTRGDRTANNINPLLATGAGQPFMEVLTTGLYALTHMPRASVVWSGTDTQSQTSGAASAGTAHTHQVNIYNGIGLHAGVISALQYRVGGSGSWTTLNDGGFYFLGGALSSFDGITTPYSAGCGVALLNLTAGWQIRHLLTFAGSQSSSDHQMQNAWSQMAVHYLGATSLDYTIT